MSNARADRNGAWTAAGVVSNATQGSTPAGPRFRRTPGRSSALAKLLDAVLTGEVANDKDAASEYLLKLRKADDSSVGDPRR